MGEQPGVPFYRSGSGDMSLACLFASNGIPVAGCLDDAARSEACKHLCRAKDDGRCDV
jgi:hypothetical protein